MIGYLRQSITCAVIPLTSIAIDSSDMAKKNEISAMIMKELRELKLEEWLSAEAAVRSTRIDAILSKVAKHADDKIVIFSCYKTFQDILRYFLSRETGSKHANAPREASEHSMRGGIAPSSAERVAKHASGGGGRGERRLDGKQRQIFAMRASMSMAARGELLEEFKNSGNGILLLTYQMGAEGLNLQFSSVVMLTDFWWNCSKTKQAIARVFRFGQIHEKIFVYYFSSNTGIEKILFQKQKAKLIVIDELMEGAMKTKIPKVKVDEIIRLIELNENRQLLSQIKHC
jgi:SNF2 family DNA or RNA helicase